MTYHAGLFSALGATLDNAQYLDASLWEMFCEGNRARWQSGLVNARAYGLCGTRNYHRPDIVNYAAHAAHDHPNYESMPGMGEVLFCVNGILGKTRHNDYKLAQPVVGNYLQTASIAAPDVPPSVLGQATPEAQIDEMRAYFTAFANQDDSRDFGPYFRWNLSYLEVWLEVLSDTIGDTYSSDRHASNVSSLYQALARHQLYAASGHQDRPENTPYIPFVVRSVNAAGKPVYALVRYRVAAVDLGSLDEVGPVSLSVREDYRLRQARNWSMDQLRASRSCRWRVGSGDEAYESGPTQIDAFMAKIPGLNGGGTLDETFNDTGTAYTTKVFGSSTQNLNIAYYNRWYAVAFTASGRQNLRRGWNDPMLWVAGNTRPECAPVYDPMMGDAPRRYSYAIPLELILRTPLEGWNPYAIPLQTTVTGSGTLASPYSGYNSIQYNHRTPAAFFAGLAPNGDPADTDAGDIRVFDGSGAVRVVRNSGIYVFLPPIAGLASPLRIRYPIAPACHEGAYEWDEAVRQGLAEQWDQLKAGGN